MFVKPKLADFNNEVHLLGFRASRKFLLPAGYIDKNQNMKKVLPTSLIPVSH